MEDRPEPENYAAAMARHEVAFPSGEAARRREAAFRRGNDFADREAAEYLKEGAAADRDRQALEARRRAMKYGTEDLGAAKRRALDALAASNIPIGTAAEMADSLRRANDRPPVDRRGYDKLTPRQLLRSARVMLNELANSMDPDLEHDRIMRESYPEPRETRKERRR